MPHHSPHQRLHTQRYSPQHAAPAQRPDSHWVNTAADRMSTWLRTPGRGCYVCRLLRLRLSGGLILAECNAGWITGLKIQQFCQFLSVLFSSQFQTKFEEIAHHMKKNITYFFHHLL